MSAPKVRLIEAIELVEGDVMYAVGHGWHRVTHVTSGEVTVRVGTMSMTEVGTNLDTVPETRPCIIITTDDGRVYRNPLDRRIEVRR